jgi:hypothetical protein
VSWLGSTPRRCFQQISFPSEWGLSGGEVQRINLTTARFQQISFPSEWGPFHQLLYDVGNVSQVSNKLVSPASGDHGAFTMNKFWEKFPTN